MTKNKHDHTATKKIKAWLFAIMLLLPFLFLIPTGLYYGLNQNAQLSETTITNNNYYNLSITLENDNMYSADDMLENTIYQLNIDDYDNQVPYIYLADLKYVQPIGGADDISNSLVDDYQFEFDMTNGFIKFITPNYQYTFYNNRIEFYLVFDSNTQGMNTLYGISFDYVYAYGTDLLVPSGENTTTTNTNDISTSIINAWNSTWQNPLFSWTSYSPFYAPMQNFTNVFGINDMQIANVLTYFATITAIYIVFDIIIELFTYLTHLIPRSD